jgi:hypothetical protein
MTAERYQKRTKEKRKKKRLGEKKKKSMKYC